MQAKGLSGVRYDLTTEEQQHSVRNPKARNYTEPAGNKAKKGQKPGPSELDVNSQIPKVILNPKRQKRKRSHLKMTLFLLKTKVQKNRRSPLKRQLFLLKPKML